MSDPFDPFNLLHEFSPSSPGSNLHSSSNNENKITGFNNIPQSSNNLKQVMTYPDLLSDYSDFINENLRL